MKYLTLLRPSHWVKNLFLFVPLFFAGEIFDIVLFCKIIIAFISFNFAASSIYVINDILDVKDDRIHPVKKYRPLASGGVRVEEAYFLACFCIILSIFPTIYLGTNFFLILIGYILWNILYSLYFKKVSILDIISLACSFELRIIAGGLVATVLVSEWLIVMAFLIALFMAIAKRRDDILIKIDSGLNVRQASIEYNLDFMNILLAFVTSSLTIAYLLYTLSAETMDKFKSRILYLTAIFVVSGLFRYLQITIVNNDSGSPVRIFYKDRFIQVCVLLWIFSFYLIIYAPKIIVSLF